MRGSESKLLSLIARFSSSSLVVVASNMYFTSSPVNTSVSFLYLTLYIVISVSCEGAEAPSVDVT